MKHFRHFLLDVEGTIVLDKRYTPAPGAVEWLDKLVSKGHQARLVTNNTTESPDDLFRILHRKGFRFSKKDFHTCLTEAVVRMRRRKVKTCLVLAKEAARKYLDSNGIRPLDTSEVDSVLVGYDPSLTYYRMNMAVKAIVENHATLFTLHRNQRFVDENREIVMSAGPIAAALEFATLTKAIACGKPDRRFFLDCIKGWDVPREEILTVSDDPFADLIGAKKLGMSTCWVLTGSQKDRGVAKKIPAKYHPDFIFGSVAEIPL
jgi:HAD superfamily hydrolase (TIGR01450 family)